MLRLSAVLTVLCLSTATFGQAITKELQDKIDAQIKQASAWAAEPAIVKAVKEQNASQTDEYKAMTQDKWKSLGVLDPFVRAFTKNDAGTLLKSKKTDAVVEAFLSAADGKKVAFLSKPTNWSHAGKPKHDDPMNGKTWQGTIEVDESTGLQQIQIAVPVLSDGKPIGSLVVGLSVSTLKE
jgi:hypothetical protein